MTKATAIEEAPALGFSRTELRGLSDDELLVRLHALPRDSDERAALCELLVERHEKLVRSCVRQYRGSPEPVEDLMQVGYVGLLKAINNYDPAFGNNLTAYATPCVSGEIKRHFRDKRWQVHVRRSAQELLLSMRKASEDLTHQLGRQPTNTELTERLGVSMEDLLEAQQGTWCSAPTRWTRRCRTTRTPASCPTCSATRMPTWSARSTWRPCHPLARLPSAKKILTMRFYGNLTQAEIGASLGISQMHVSRLLSRALTHLRSRLLDVDVNEPLPS